jgi:magnesium-transporting ATPase (P-type)
MGIFNAFNARTSHFNLFHNIRKNKVFIIIFLLVGIIQIYFIYFGGTIFRTYGLTLKELIFILALAFTVIPVDLIRKSYLRKKNYQEYV